MCELILKLLIDIRQSLWEKNMGWLKRLFGLEKPKNAQSNPNLSPAETSVSQQPASVQTSSPTTAAIPLERMGLNGEYDQSGLAKRVALAFDESPEVDDIETIYVAQLGSTVVLKGTVPNQEILNQLVSVAKSVKGVTAVETNQVNLA